MRRISRAAMLLTLLGFTACGDDGGGGPPTTTTPPASTTPTAKISLVVDTDLASDDIVALAYLAADDRADLLAVTVSGTGEVRCPIGAAKVRALLDRLGKPDVPVACGRSTPLSGDRVFPSDWRDAADSAYGLPLPAASTPDPALDAVTLLTQTISSAPGPATLLTLGPPTNVAEAFAAHPDLVGRLAGIVMMGGALAVAGNVQPDLDADPLPVEWNLYIDPTADAAVIGSGAPVTLVALDATNAVPIDSGVVAELAANDRTDASGVASFLLTNAAPPYLWDTLAAIATTHPEFVPSRSATIGVVTEGDEAGRTVEQPAGTAVRVALAPDATVVLDHLIRTLAGLGPDEPLVVPTTLAAVGQATVSFDGTVCTYDGPTAVPSGPVVFTRQLGANDYLLVVAHLVPGVTVEETMAWAAANGSGQPPGVDSVSAVGDLPGTMPSPATITLEPGTYMVVCISPDETVYLGSAVTVS